MWLLPQVALIEPKPLPELVVKDRELNEREVRKSLLEGLSTSAPQMDLLRAAGDIFKYIC